MIKIQRAEEPAYLNTSTAQDRYSHPSVIDTLWRMQHRKCCYCERSIKRTGTEKEVEHFRPRKDFEHLTNEWGNLLLACRPCNQKKRRHFPKDGRGRPLLIDPSDDALDPEDELEFIVDLKAANTGSVHQRHRSRKGAETVEKIGLAGAHHIERRMEQLKILNVQYINLMIAKIRDEEDGEPVGLRQARNHFETLLSARSPFAALAREFARANNLDDDFGVRIHAGAETGD